MTPIRFQLAQANIARMRAPLESEVMEGFRSQLARINALADASAGFVWRLQSDEGDATAIRAFEDPRILFNMSVWESLEALHAYVYRSEHVGPLRRRRAWFEALAGRASVVLWWIPEGRVPTIAEAVERLALLDARGPSAAAFTFREPFAPPGARGFRAPELDAEFCGGVR